jgi:hypothetical protein
VCSGWPSGRYRRSIVEGDGCYSLAVSAIGANNLATAASWCAPACSGGVRVGVRVDPSYFPQFDQHVARGSHEIRGISRINGVPHPARVACKNIEKERKLKGDTSE